jgi:hypothetical protein
MWVWKRLANVEPLTYATTGAYVKMNCNLYCQLSLLSNLGNSRLAQLWETLVICYSQILDPK